MIDNIFKKRRRGLWRIPPLPWDSTGKGSHGVFLEQNPMAVM